MDSGSESELQNQMNILLTSYKKYVTNVQVALDLLVAIRACEVCTMSGNGHCSEHVIGTTLQELNANFSEITGDLDQL